MIKLPPEIEAPLVAASQETEGYFPRILQIRDAISLPAVKVERATAQFSNLQSVFIHHAEVLRSNRKILLNAAAIANTGVHQFHVTCGVPWRCAHLAVIEAIESFLRSVLNLFQPSAEFDADVDISRPVTVHELRAAELAFSWTVKEWIRQHDAEKWCKALKELVAGERLNFKPEFSGYFPTKDWAKAWNPPCGLSKAKEAIRELEELGLAKRKGGKPHGDVAIKTLWLDEHGISEPSLVNGNAMHVTWT